MELLVGEATTNEDGNLDPFELRRPGGPPLVAERVVDLPSAQIFVGTPLPFYAGVPQAAETVLADTARAREVAVEVREPFPGADGREVRWA